jgi:hypothetical protein
VLSHCRMKIKVIIIFILFLLESCWKNIDDTANNCTSDCTTISGRIMTEGGTVPASGLNFQFDWVIKGELGGTYRNIKRFKSDKNGYFEFSFHATDQELFWGGGYSIKYLDSANNFVNLKDLIDDFPVIGTVTMKRRDTLINKILWIPRRSYIRFKILNPNIQTGGSVYYKFGDVSSDRFYHSPGWIYSNQQLDKIIEAAGNQINYIRINQLINQQNVNMCQYICFEIIYYIEHSTL